MNISKDELNYLLKNARNTGFAVAFIACFCIAIVGGLFALYIYKSFNTEIAGIDQSQLISGVSGNSGVVANENGTKTISKN